MAMHGYHGVHGRLPAAVVYGEDGRPLLSWRVLILPYIEEQALFARFKLEEPWDSPHNIQLLQEMPVLFGPFDGSTPPEPHSTFYQVFVGKGTAFEGRAGLRLREDFPHGTSNTILIVEAGTAVPWTKPEDLPYEAGQPLPKLGGIVKGSFRAALVDGSVTDYSQDLDEARLRATIARQDGHERRNERATNKD
jgi:hypothetical protein